MDEEFSILLTNDDGIESVGFRALYDSLSSIATVTAVAPADDQSAVGRKLSEEVRVEDHDLGYAIYGTPADCVVAGLTELCPDTDLVVAGCNRGANLGAYVLGRSGTVSAAVEAAFFDVPAIATSLYLDVEDFLAYEPTVEDFAVPAHATRYLANHAMGAGVFDRADYLNVNAPDPSVDAPEMVVTRPSHVYDMDTTNDGDSITLHDRVWERMAAEDIEDPPGTDRKAVVEGKVSVSPLTAPHTTEHHEALDGLAETYPESLSD